MPTAPPPPHLPPRMLPVASKYTQRPRGAVGRWWWPSLAHASRVSLGGRHGRPRACVAVEHAGCERRSVTADARNRRHICILNFSLRSWQRLSLHDAWVEYEPHPHCPSESVDFGSWRRGAVAFSSEACRPTQPQWRLSAVPIGLGRRVRRLSSRLVGVFSFSDVSRRCDCRNGPKCAAGGTPHLRSGAAHTTARGIWGFPGSLRRAR